MAFKKGHESYDLVMNDRLPGKWGKRHQWQWMSEFNWECSECCKYPSQSEELFLEHYMGFLTRDVDGSWNPSVPVYVTTPMSSKSSLSLLRMFSHSQLCEYYTLMSYLFSSNFNYMYSPIMLSIISLSGWGFPLAPVRFMPTMSVLV